MQINKSNDSEVTEMHFKQEFLQRLYNFFLNKRECADDTTKMQLMLWKLLSLPENWLN